MRLQLAALGPCLSGPIVPLATSRFPRAPPPSPRPPPPLELPPVSGFDGRFAAAKEAAGQLASLVRLSTARQPGCEHAAGFAKERSASGKALH